MKTHTTSTLRSLVMEGLNPKQQLSTQEIETWADVLPEIKEELAKQMKFFARSIFHKSLVKKQLQQMQSECTILLNAIDRYKDLKEEVLPLKVLAIDCLDYTLDKILNEYRPYADLSHDMSRIHYRARLEIIKGHQHKVDEKFKELEVAADLQSVVMECINELLSKKTASYLRVQYVADFQLYVIDVLSRSTTDGVKESLCDLLYNLHYNTERFIDFIKREYKQNLEDVPDIHDKKTLLMKLYHLPTKQKSTPKRPKYIWERSMIYDRLIDFLDTEVRCLNILIEKAKPKRVPISAPIAVPLKALDYKLRFNFSVDCLAYLIKLMVNANLIEPGIKAELLRYVAANFQTPGTKVGGIAEGSFLTKYKNVTQSTSVTVKAGLMAMLKLVDKEF
jgi:hypothetical protein